GALVAALLLVHLDHDFLALAQQLADPGAAADAGLVVIAGDFLQRQEAVAVAAVLDEGRFKRGLEPGDAALVDVGLLLFLGRLFDVDVVQVLAVHDRHAQFFGLRGVDQHAFHCCVPRALLPRGTPWALRLVWLQAAPAGAVAPRRDGEPSRAAARPSGCSSATTPRQTAGALCVLHWFVLQDRRQLVAGPQAPRGACSAPFREIIRGCAVETDDGRACQ